MAIFNCYVSSPEGTSYLKFTLKPWKRLQVAFHEMQCDYFIYLYAGHPPTKGILQNACDSTNKPGTGTSSFFWDVYVPHPWELSIATLGRRRVHFFFYVRYWKSGSILHHPALKMACDDISIFVTSSIYTLWLFNIAMEAMAHWNRWFSQLETSIDEGFSMAMLVITRWYIYILDKYHGSPHVWVGLIMSKYVQIIQHGRSSQRSGK